METQLLKVALRQSAIYISQAGLKETQLKPSTIELVKRFAKIGFSLSEDALRSINGWMPVQQLKLLKELCEIKGINKNWTPLVKQWDVPTGEGWFDHVVTYFVNAFGLKRGSQLQCGHYIPEGTFPLERYNGCPFCGTPFEFDELELTESSNPLNVLEVWTDSDLQQYLTTLLQSPVALDAVQTDDLKILLQHVDLPDDVDIKMKETKMLVIDALVAKNELTQAGTFFDSPADILRYLWYKHTGFLQVIEPKIIANKLHKNSVAYWATGRQVSTSAIKAKASLQLKFKRPACRMYADWLNNLTMPVAKQGELMHTKRGIWVRVIRALRLAEFSKKKGYEQLATLLDAFYNKNYTVWNGEVEKGRIEYDAKKTFGLLKQKPGAFARSLFANMLWFGDDIAVGHFKEVADKVPLRLLLSLNMYAPLYFEKGGNRIVKTNSGLSKRIPKNQLVELHEQTTLDKATLAVRNLTLDAIQKNYAGQASESQNIFIDEQLFNIPLAIGDRLEQLQDVNPTLMGTTFKVEGDKLRLFMNWGEGLKAQHLDMDLSCLIAYENKLDKCSYQQLSTTGCKHSGDIQRIPNKAGTAEYIELDLGVLENHLAKYVCFTCNAYTSGSLSANMVVGWMNSQYPMTIKKSGVAYDPTAVQHQIRITEGLAKGLLFGVLDVAKREIIWMELPFGGQVVQNLDLNHVEGMLQKLSAKIKIGELLQLKAKAQQLTVVDEVALADEVYDLAWAGNTAAVSALLLSA